ncbi:Phosphatidylcholine translocator ABCB4 [Frankliniella fusca]|uniref:Phosphatidylcholine translocator ABCB4 n=1 Tax=Frankliniella fusca TaxID=407009 RepID=A0AAE1HQP1_9NEOP|nr:Phosphatidylcholine translocator ABCB4 [Frankliniella fusca]
MSKIVQRGASALVRGRLMSSLPEKNISPEKIAEWGQKINPAQTVYGPKNPNLEKWQKFFQDPLHVQKPVFLRKGGLDELIVSLISMGVGASFIYNVYLFNTK